MGGVLKDDYYILYVLRRTDSNKIKEGRTLSDNAQYNELIGRTHYKHE